MEVRIAMVDEPTRMGIPRQILNVQGEVSARIAMTGTGDLAAVSVAIVLRVLRSVRLS